MFFNEVVMRIASFILFFLYSFTVHSGIDGVRDIKIGMDKNEFYQSIKKNGCYKDLQEKNNIITGINWNYQKSKNNCFKFHGFHTSRESFHFENGKLKNIEIQIYSDNLEKLSKIHKEYDMNYNLIHKGNLGDNQYIWIYDNQKIVIMYTKYEKFTIEFN